MVGRTGVVVACVAASVVGCSSHDAGGPELPSLADVRDAPTAIRNAARAVVRIGTAGEFGTGSFISPTGVLLTNNHVLGVDICPLEGCYAQLSFLHQRGAPSQDAQTVFVVPLAIDVGLDIAALQAYASPGSPPLATPDYLTLETREPAALQGTHVHLVGHPEGGLKKWTQGTIVDAGGSWIWGNAYSLPGSSGSPVLDDDGHMVGILHRGPTAQDMVTSGGVDEYFIGTASGPLIAALGAPLPAALRSVKAQASADDVVAHQAVYLNARATTALVDGASVPVTQLLGAACDTGLARQDYASPEDLTTGLAPCIIGGHWIDCRSDAPPAPYAVCPDDVDAWAKRYAGVFDRGRTLNGQGDLDMVSFAPAALASSQTAGQSSGMQKLQAALGATSPFFDLSLTPYLAAFAILTYDGASVLDAVHGYARFPDYGLSGRSIASAALWLNHLGILSGADATTFLNQLDGDARIELGTKLYIEDVLYQSDRFAALTDPGGGAGTQGAQDRHGCGPLETIDGDACRALVIGGGGRTQVRPSLDASVNADATDAADAEVDGAAADATRPSDAAASHDAGTSQDGGATDSGTVTDGATGDGSQAADASP